MPDRDVVGTACPNCGDLGPLKVRMRAEVEMDALGFIASSVVIDVDELGGDVWSVDEVYCEECGQSVPVDDYEPGAAVPADA